MKSRLRSIAVLMVGMLPASSLKNAALRFHGLNVDRAAAIGPNVIWRVAKFSADAGARVAPFNVFRDLNAIEIGHDATLGSWNWVSSAREFLNQSADNGVLRLEMGAAITSRHYLDTSGGIKVGKFAILGGQRCTVLSHGIEFGASVQTTAPVILGAYSFVSSNCTLLKGAVLPSESVLAAGAVLSKAKIGSENPAGLWGGVPARWIKEIHGAYFTRTEPFVPVRPEAS